MHSPTTTYAGIDWASRSHVLCVIDAAGTVIERLEVEHATAGDGLSAAVERGRERDGGGAVRGEVELV